MAEVGDFRRVTLAYAFKANFKPTRKRLLKQSWGTAAESGAAPDAVKALLARAVKLIIIGAILFASGVPLLMMAVNAETVNEGWVGIPGGVLCLFGLFTLPCGLVGLCRWLRRIGSARGGEWRSGSAALLWHRVGDSRTLLRVRFAGGEDREFMTTAGVIEALPLGLFDESEVKVWVNGSGKAVTVMFAYGPLIVAAKSKTGEFDGAKVVARRFRNAIVVVCASVACLAGFQAAEIMSAAGSEWLLAHGQATPGTVVDDTVGFDEPDDAFRVGYHVNGKYYENVVSRSPGKNRPVVYKGMSVAVVYDPENPDRIRTHADSNDISGSVSGFFFALSLFLVAFLIFGLISVGRWGKRLAARRGEWRPGEVEFYRLHDDRRQRLYARLDTGEEFSLVPPWLAFFHTPRAACLGPQRVQVNGDGKAMTLLFENGWTTAVRREELTAEPRLKVEVPTQQ